MNKGEVKEVYIACNNHRILSIQILDIKMLIIAIYNKSKYVSFNYESINLNILFLFK
jgi:hypothetical protein